ncbi:MAG: hypothetical protein CVV25_08470 [Ignavibacteriae bacterium HGW-Ignavibacteriae-4]|nr:MAG: hypothetical protein CVV25_08470 [Ignavibacteriae bacterium HGW-Ignavibacteriae-4]
MLLFSGLTKIIDPIPLINVLNTVQFFNDQVNLIIVSLLPLLEIMLGILLLSRQYLKITAATICVLFGNFLVFSIYGNIIGLENNCGCFGNLIRSDFNIIMILRNTLFFLVSIFILTHRDFFNNISQNKNLQRVLLNIPRRNNKLTYFVIILIFITSLYQLLFDDLFKLTNLYKDNNLNADYFFLLTVPLIQLIIIVFIFLRKRILFSLLGLLFITPFIISESKDFVISLQLLNKYEKYSEGINIPNKAEHSTYNKKIDKINIEKSIDLAANYIFTSILESGKFLYKRNLNPQYDTYQGEYNILRHAAALYTLAQYSKYEIEDEKIRQLLKTGYWLKSTIININHNENIRAVWSPKKNEETNFDQAKLGGSALALIALLELEKIQNGFTTLASLTSLGEFLLFMQKESGDFYSRFIPQYGGRTARDKSLFYPGQAILALVSLYEHTADIKWIDAAVKGLDYLIKSRKVSGEYPLDHWILIATNKLMVFWGKSKFEIAVDEVIFHTKQICNNFINFYEERDEDSSFYGCFSNDGKTCYTASTIEGLISALQMLPESELKDEVNKMIFEGVLFLINAQVPEGVFVGAIPNTIKPWEIVYKNEMELAGEIRIDYTQHFLNGLMNYKNMMYN